MSKEKDTAIIILAAGRSSRLGRLKQMVVFQRKTLLQHALDVANESQANKTYLVLGAFREQIIHELDLGLKAVLVENDDWEKGLSHSLNLGLTKAIAEGFSQVIIMLCDQPFVSTEVLDSLISTKNQQQVGIVASAYQGTLGVPVLFDQKYFPELLNLSGEAGAKKILYKHLDDARQVTFPLGYIDIDTEEDVSRLQKMQLI